MSPHLRTLLLTSTALLALGSAPGMAGPDGPVVVGGTAAVTGAGTASVVVNQSSSKAIINWNTFNIGAGETTTFVQPGASSVALNRVTGGLGPSQIYGTLNANGQVFVINRDGVLVGASGVINTAGFLASTHDINNADFMAGRYNFNIPGRPDASIVNLGSITATSGGFAALVAPGVRNSGTITATLGTVALAAGNSFTLDLYGDKLIQLAPSDAIAAQVVDVATGKPLTALVSNDGKLSANGGRVELTATAARAVVDSVINTSGVIEANSVGTRDGRIVLGAATAATKPANAPKQTVKVSGTLSAAGKDKGSKGGTVVVTGEDIQVSGAKIDVSGDAGGGKAMLGGDWAGGNPMLGLVSNQSAALETYQIATATTLNVDATTTIDASARSAGDGGKVILWSDNQTTFAGTIFARGGEAAGNGGFVEVSGKQNLAFTGQVDTRAPNGMTGTLLLDPENIIIGYDETIDPATLVASLATTNVTIATGAGEGYGDITVADSFTWSSSNSLTLSAYRNVKLNSEIEVVNTGGADIVLRADNTGTGIGTVILRSGSLISTTGAVSIFYNPSDDCDCDSKYQNPTNYSSKVTGQLTAYMLVNNFSDLKDIKYNLSGTYALGKDVDADGQQMSPIGYSTPFTGLLDGQNHTISNAIIAPEDSSDGNVGLFAAIGVGGTVRNLNLTNFHVTADPYPWGPGQFVGVLAGSNAGTIDNVHVNNSTVSGIPIGIEGDLTGIIAGGLVGQNGMLDQYNEPTAGKISNSSASDVIVTVGNGSTCSDCYGGMNIAGGLVGSNVAGSTITNSQASGIVSGGEASFVGGLVGQNGIFGYSTGSISSSFANVAASISGLFSAVGGLVGSNAQDSTITDSQAIGSVTSTATRTRNQDFTSAGGLVGQNAGTITSTAVPELASNCAAGASFSCATGNVQVGGLGTGGGLVGNNQGTIENSFATGAVTGAAGLPEDGEGGRSTQLGGLAGNNQGTIKNSFATGNVGTIKTDEINVAWLNVGGLVGDNSGLIQNSFATGQVRAGDNAVAGGLVGSNNINTCDCFQNQGTGADNSGTITGSWASGNVTVGNTSVAGGLAAVNDGTITGSSASGNVTGGADSVLGGLVGAFGLEGGSLTNSTATGNVTGTGANSIIGGLVGLNAGTIGSTLSSTGNVTGDTWSYIGGLVGLNAGRIDGVVQSTPDATVTGLGSFNAIGGLVGGNVGTIVSSSAQRNVSAGDYASVGGLVGANMTFDNVPAPEYLASSLIPGSSFPVGTISNSAASGNVTGSDWSLVGGLVGSNGGSISGSTASGNVTGGAYSLVGGLVGWNSGPYMTPGLPAILSGACNVEGCNVLVNATVSQEPGSITDSSASGAVNGGYGAFMGGLVGFNLGTIGLSYATGNVSGDTAGFLGGFAGFNVGSIDNSHATGNVSTDATSAFAGGFAGFNAGAITLSYAKGNVSGGPASFLGGFAGINVGSINQTYARGAVSGGDGSFIGGFVGINVAFPDGEGSSPGSITQSYALGPVTGSNAVVAAGFAALNLGTLDQTYAVGHVTAGAGSTTGGLVASNGVGTLPFTFPGFGDNNKSLQTNMVADSTAVVIALSNGTATNSYWDRQTTGQETSAGGTAMDTAVLAGAVPPGFDPTIWAHGSYPHLVNLGPQNTEPGLPVLPPLNPNPPPDPPPPEPTAAPPAPPAPPSQLLQVNNNNQNNGPPTLPVLYTIETFTPAPQLEPPVTQTASINNPIQLNVGANRYFFLPPPEETRLVANEVVIQLPCNVPEQTLNAALSTMQLSVLNSQCLATTNVAVYRLRTPDNQALASVIRGLANHRIIAAAQANYVYTLGQTPASLGQAPVPERLGDSGQYVLDKLRLGDIHRRVNANTVPIAVIDSEIDGTHPDLEGVTITRYNATGEEEKPHAHGTGMAGAIASNHRLLGTAPGAPLYAIRAFSSNAANAESTTFNILKGLDYAVTNNVRIVNMSFAGPRDPTIERALKFAYDKGVILIAAAGNAGPKSPPLFPAADKHVIAVTATDIDDVLFTGATRGNHIAVSAPGVDILVPAPEGAYQMTTGTSVATAHVSGIVALMLERNPQLTPADVRRILTASAKRLGPHDQFGAGLIDPTKALQLAAPRTVEASDPTRR